MAIAFTILLAFLSHFIVDAFAKITYHTPEPQKEDKIWVAWMYISIGITMAFVVWVIIIGRFWFFFLGGFFSVLVDIIDWGILRPYQNKKNKQADKSYWQQGYFFHLFIDKIRDRVPPFSWLPDWNYKHKGILPELLIITILWIIIIILLGIFSFP